MEFDEQVGEEYNRDRETLFDYKIIVGRHVRRIINLSSTVPFAQPGQWVSTLADIQAAYHRAVRGLECLIAPYLDAEYNKAKEGLELKTYDGRAKQFEALLCLLHRRGLLPESEEEEQV